MNEILAKRMELQHEIRKLERQLEETSDSGIQSVIRKRIAELKEKLEGK